MPTKPGALESVAARKRTVADATIDKPTEHEVREISGAQMVYDTLIELSSQMLFFNNNDIRVSMKELAAHNLSADVENFTPILIERTNRAKNEEMLLVLFADFLNKFISTIKVLQHDIQQNPRVEAKTRANPKNSAAVVAESQKLSNSLLVITNEFTSAIGSDGSVVDDEIFDFTPRILAALERFSKKIQELW